MGCTGLSQEALHVRISDVLADKAQANRGHVVTVWPDTRLGYVARLFDARNIASVVVVDRAGKVMGIVSDREVVRALAQYGEQALEMRSAQVMLSPAFACDPGDTVGEVLRMMTDNRVRHVLVLRDGVMVGIVSIGDLVKIRLTDAELENRVLREMAMARLVL